MKLHFHSSATSHETERAAHLARAHAGDIAASVDNYLAFFRDADLDDAGIRRAAASLIDALGDWRPHLAAELLALAAECGLPAWQLAAVNGRTEVMATAGRPSHECSTIAHVPATGEAWGMQTWDWHPGLVQTALAWTLTARSGRRVTTFTEFGAQAKIGVNDTGIGVMFNFLSHASDTGKQGVPVHSIARAILEETSSIVEARELLTSAPLAASTAFTVIEAGGARAGDGAEVGAGIRAGARVAAEDSAGAAVSFEACPAGIGEVSPDAAGILRRTNHFLDPALAAGERVPFAESRSLERRELLGSASEAIAQTANEPDPATRAAALHRGAGSGLCFRPDALLPPNEQWETLLTAVLSPRAGSLDLSVQQPAPAADMTFTRVSALSPSAN